MISTIENERPVNFHSRGGSGSMPVINAHSPSRPTSKQTLYKMLFSSSCFPFSWQYFFLPGQPETKALLKLNKKISLSFPFKFQENIETLQTKSPWSPWIHLRWSLQWSKSHYIHPGCQFQASGKLPPYWIKSFTSFSQVFSEHCSPQHQQDFAPACLAW